MRPLVLGAFVLTIGCAFMLGCNTNSAPHLNPPPAVLATPEIGDAPVLLAIGDSLTAGFGVAADEAWIAVLGTDLKAKDSAWRVRNAGVSGDTSAGVRRRVDWLLTPDIQLVVLCIGANDGLRGLSVDAMRDHIRATVRSIQARGVTVVLAGMRLPPNYGATYIEAFEASWALLSKELSIPLIPFLLEGVAADPELNQADGIHPNPEGHRRIAAHVLKALEGIGAFKTSDEPAK